MQDYCEACGSDNLDHFLNGDVQCNECGYIQGEDEEE